jgi:hypothetical protein
MHTPQKKRIRSLFLVSALAVAASALGGAEIGKYLAPPASAQAAVGPSASGHHVPGSDPDPMKSQ